MNCSVEAVSSDSQCDKAGDANSSSVENFIVEFSDFLREYGRWLQIHFDSKLR